MNRRQSLGPVFRATSVAALGGLLFGYDTAVIAGTVDFLQARFQLSDLALGWTVSSALLGCMAGAWIAGWMGDALGRKVSLLVCAVSCFVSAVWSGIPSSAGELAVARIVGGMGVGAASMLTPVYISEISPSRLRGALTTVNQIAILLGVVLVYFVNAKLAVAGDEAWRVATAWRWMFASEALPAALFFLLLFSIPESPRWLMLNGLERKAHDSLLLLGLEADALLVTRKASIGHFKDCLQPAVLPIFLTGATLAILQQITGINIVMYYAPRIFTSAGLDSSSAIGHSVLIGAIMLIFTCAAVFLADRLGRRPLLLNSVLGMAVGLFALGSEYAKNPADRQAWLLLLWVLVYVASFSIGLGPLIWMIIGEIFPSHVRTHAAGACLILLWTANFLVSQFFPALLARYNEGVFWGFGVICLITLVFIYKKIPETKQCSLEDIERNWNPRP